MGSITAIEEKINIKRINDRFVLYTRVNMLI